MNKKLKELQRSKVKFFGFEYESKPFWITMGIALGVLLVLIAVNLLGVNVSWYGILFGTGFLVALALSGQLAKERGINSDFPFTLVWFVFPCSIIGARLYYLIFNGGIESLGQIVRIWEGGLAIYGGVIGGAIGLIACCLWKKISIGGTTDFVAPLLALGQSFGRIGCIFGNCCYGVEVANKALRWFPIAIQVHGEYHYATNLYEAVLDFALFIGLTIALRKTKIKGLPTFAYMFGYGLIRFILESFRATEQTLLIGNYPVSKLVSILCVFAGVIGITVLLFVNNRKEERVEK